MANKAFAAVGVSGGSTGFMDTIKTATITDADICFVIANSGEEFYVYTFDSGNVAAESSPDVVYPDDAAGTEAWILCDMTIGVGTIRETLGVTGAATFASTVAVTGALTAPSLQLGGAGATPTEFSTDGTMAGNSDTAIPTEKAVVTYVGTIAGTMTYDIMAGWVVRSTVAYKDADELYIGAGRYHHKGTTEQIVKWDSQLTFQIGSGGTNGDSSDAGTSQWHYLYIDDSAVDAAGTNVLTNTEFVNSTTAPTWSEAEHGWYNGSDRCIFAFYVNSSGNIDIFRANDKIVYWNELYNTSFSFTAAFTACTFRVPAFADFQLVPVTLYATGAVDSRFYYWRTTDGAASGGHIIGYAYNSGSGDNRRDNTVNNIIVQTNTSGQADFKVSNTASGTNSALYQDGYILPRGM